MLYCTSSSAVAVSYVEAVEVASCTLYKPRQHYMHITYDLWLLTSISISVASDGLHQDDISANCVYLYCLVLVLVLVYYYRL